MRCLGVLVALMGLGALLTILLQDELIEAWAEGNPGAREILREGGVEALKASSMSVPAFAPVVGVMVPSVDRVGRYFPLTIATELPSHTAVADAVFAGAHWFAGLEEAALGMLDSGQGPDDLDAALANLAFKLPQTAAVEESVGAPQALRSTEAFEWVAKARALAAWSQEKGWRALWWTRGRVDGGPLMFASSALPTAAEFAKLLESGKPSASAILGS